MFTEIYFLYIMLKLIMIRDVSVDYTIDDIQWRIPEMTDGEGGGAR